MDFLVFFVPALRIILGLLFVVTSALKFPHLKEFSVIVASYGMLPRKLVKPAAYSQPIIEFLVGAWILSGAYLFEAAIAGLFLMVLADVFVIGAYVKGERLENCGCYGVNFKSPLNKKKIAENLVWTALFVVLILATL